MVVWIQFPGLPVHFYHKELLFTLGNLIGRSIKLDFHTQNQQRAKFARMAVEVDLSKPLVPRIRLDGYWQRVEYENLPMVCFECGRVGHTNLSCPDLDRRQGEEGKTVAVPAGDAPTGDTKAESNAGYGPWMVVTRKSRRNQGEQIKHGKLEAEMETSNGSLRIEERKEALSMGKSYPQNNSRFQPTQRVSAGNKLEADKKGKNNGKNGKGDNKGKGKVVDHNPKLGEGLLGPHPMEASSSRPMGEDSQSFIQVSPLIKATKEKRAEQLKPIGNVTVATQTVAENNGTRIRVVEAQPYTPPPPRVVDPEAPSAVARTKKKSGGKKERNKGMLTPKKGTPIRHNPGKPLQIWTPIKERKGRSRDRRVSLTLKQIQDWTEMARAGGDGGSNLVTPAREETMTTEATGTAEATDRPSG
ncbi:unnamed protein product [Linum tenue]|uniref:CCHC-type domain-containing protein n=1 Tax=Linum tenue TaxID=586396 RepID=A0AAV0S8H6_9ROSI|nr:unnamed protein product [Linum tenue]